jgi:hypothetical protein
MPYPDPSWLRLSHATTKSPSASIATAGYSWLKLVVVLTRNSPPPWATPAALYRRP